MRKVLFACMACIALASCKKESVKEQPKPQIISVSQTVLTQPMYGSYYQAPDNYYQNGIMVLVIPFTVTAGDKDAYIPNRISLVTDGSISKPITNDIPAVEVAVDNKTVLEASAQYQYSYINYYDHVAQVDNNGNFHIPAGSSLALVAVVVFIPPAAGEYRARIVNINCNTDDSQTLYTPYTDGLDGFSTPYIQANF